jgi:hypothetical protein
MNNLELAKLLLRLSEDPQPRRALQREAADLILAAHRENPGLTLTHLTMYLNNDGVWTGRRAPHRAADRLAPPRPGARARTRRCRLSLCARPGSPLFRPGPQHGASGGGGASEAPRLSRPHHSQGVSGPTGVPRRGSDAPVAAQDHPRSSAPQSPDPAASHLSLS